MKKSKKFSDFDTPAAFKKLQIRDLLCWHIDFQPLQPR
jgi:hypothetical protein